MQNKEIILIISIAYLITLLLAVFIVFMIFQYGRKHILLKTQADHTLLKTQLDIQEHIFRSISQELHDNIMQSLGMLKRHLYSIESDSYQSKQQDIIQLVTLCQEDIKNLSRNLNSDYIRHNGLIKMMENFTDQLKKISFLIVSFEVSGEPVFLEDDAEIMLYRIAQEAVNNIIKHSKAKKIVIRLKYTQDHLKLTITDDGIGFNVQEKLSNGYSSGSCGLQNMVRRTKMIHANLEIQSNNLNGTNLCITIPFKTATDRI